MQPVPSNTQNGLSVVLNGGIPSLHSLLFLPEISLHFFLAQLAVAKAVLVFQQ